MIDIVAQQLSGCYVLEHDTESLLATALSQYGPSVLWFNNKSCTGRQPFEAFALGTSKPWRDMKKGSIFRNGSVRNPMKSRLIGVKLMGLCGTFNKLCLQD